MTLITEKNVEIPVGCDDLRCIGECDFAFAEEALPTLGDALSTAFSEAFLLHEDATHWIVAGYGYFSQAAEIYSVHVIL